MPPTSKISPRVATYLATRGPATIGSIAQALGVRRISVSTILRAESKYCVVGHAEKRRSGQPSQLWKLLRPGEVPPRVAAPKSARELVYEYLTRHDPAPASVIADALNLAAATVRQTLRVFSDLFFMVDVRTGADGTGTKPVQFWSVAQSVAPPLVAKVVEWTHTNPAGRSWALRGRVVAEDADGVHVLACGMNWVLPVADVREVAA